MSIWDRLTKPRTDGLPPGPRAPALLQTWAWAKEPLRYLEGARRTFGPVFTSRLVGFPPLVHFSEPDAIRDVFTGPAADLFAGEANRVLLPVLGPESVLLLDGEKHFAARKVLLPPFHGQRMGAYSESMWSIAERHIRSWPHDRPFAAYPRLAALTLDIILKTVFGTDSGAEETLLRERLTRLLSEIVSPILLLPALQKNLGPLTPWAGLMALRDAIDLQIKALIERRREALSQGEEHPDVLSLLLRATHDDSTPLATGELRDQLMTLLVAGHDTVATALAWACFHLVKHPLIHEKCRSEADLDSVRAGAEATWIDATIKEALRLTPVLPIVARRLQKDMTIGGVRLPAGVRAAPNIHLAHREPSAWPDPETFDPRRFIGTKVSPYSFLPFGGGSRRCLGMAFSLFEMRIVLAVLLRERDLRTASDRLVAERRGVVFTPSQGMPLLARPRRNAP